MTRIRVTQWNITCQEISKGMIDGLEYQCREEYLDRTTGEQKQTGRIS